MCFRHRCGKWLVIVALTLGSPVLAGPIHDAALAGDLLTVERLLDEDTDVDVRDERGATALHWAAAGNHAEILEFLLAQGASVNTQDNQGMMPLHAAAARDSTGVAEILVDHGARVDEPNENGATPLHMAAMGGGRDVAEQLISLGAEIDARADGGVTPLHLAAMSASTAAAQLLIDNGADVNAEDDDGMTPLNFAASSGDPQIEALLRAHGAELTPVCVTREDIEEMNRGAARRLFVLRGVDAKVFLALDPRLTGEFADAFDALMARDIDEMLVFRLTNVPGGGLAAAVPFSQGCASEGYGEPDMLDKIELMRDGVNRIRRSGVDDSRVRAILRELWEDERPVTMTDEEFENRMGLQLDRVRELLEAQSE